MRLGAVVPAAGLSRRMRAEKILLPFRGSTMLESVLAALASLDVETAVVLRPGLEEAGRLASRARARVVWNREPEAEMLVSIRLGVEALSPSLDAFFVWPADHPAVRPATLRLLAAEAAPDRVLIPSYRSRRGHPALVGGDLREDLLRIPAGEGLRWLWRDRSTLVRELPVEDPGVVANLDTPEAYERALEEENDAGRGDRPRG